jgi:signal transduction histidine kinase
MHFNFYKFSIVILTSILLFNATILHANQVDSLKGIINSNKLDTSTINKLNNTIYELVLQNNNESEYFLKRLVSITDSLHYINGQAQAHYNFYFYFKMKGSYPEALDHVIKSMAYYQKVNNIRGLIDCNKGAGIMYIYNQKLKEAQQYFEKALKMAENYAKDEVGDCYNNLGFIYMGINDFDKAFVFYEKSIKYHKEYHNEVGLAKALTNMGIICREKKEIQKALKYLEEAKQHFETNQLTWGIILTHINVGICQSMNGDYQSAIDNQKKALTLAKQAGDKENLANAYYGLYESYKAMGNFKLSLANYEMLTKIKDTVFSEESNKRLNELLAKYETEKKENEIKSLKQENQIKQLELIKKRQQVYFSYGIVLLLVIGGIIGYMYYRNRQIQKLRETVLNTEISERTRIAKDMHDELGASLTKILVVSEVAKSNLDNQKLVTENIKSINTTVKDLSSNIRDFVWTLNPENATLENLSIKLREFCSDIFDEAGIGAIIDIQDEFPSYELSKKVQRNIYLACKESVNNIVKHANSSKALFTFKTEGEKIIISIEDYGKGFNKASIKTTGNGLHNIVKRIEDIGGKASIESTLDKGTSIYFSINMDHLA